MKDGLALVDGQISDKSGISGAAIKLAYKTVTTFSPDHIQYMVYTLLPSMAEKLQPYWDDFGAAGGGVVRRLPRQARRGGVRDAARRSPTPALRPLTAR